MFVYTNLFLLPFIQCLCIYNVCGYTNVNIGPWYVESSLNVLHSTNQLKKFEL